MDTPTSGISPLRQRMIEDMRMRKFGEKTQSQYLRAVRQFAKYLGRSPDTASVRSCEITSCIWSTTAFRRPHSIRRSAD